MLRRVSWSLVLLGATLGVIACMVASLAAWRVTARVNHVAAMVLDQVEAGLDAMSRRTSQLDEQVQSLEQASADLMTFVEQQVEGQLESKLLAELDLGKRIDQLSVGVDEVDTWVALTESSTESVGGLVELLDSTGASLDASKIVALEADLASLRGRWAEMRDLVHHAQALVERVEAGDSIPKQTLREVLAKIAASVLPVHEAIHRFTQRIKKAEENVPVFAEVLQRRVRVVGFVAVATLVWLAAGQLALGYLAWRGARR